MSFLFDANGLTIQTYAEIFAQIEADYKAIYGPDIDTAPNSPDGQRIGIEAKARLDLQTFALDLYNQFDPDFSAGEMLDKIIKLSGLARGVATRSQVDVDVVTDRGLTLPTGYTVRDTNGQEWVTDSPVVIAAAGTTAVTLFAKDFGAIAAAPGTITEPADVVLGVTSVTNPLAAVAGRDEETDPELRLRRNRSLVSPKTSSRAGMFTALGNLEAVTDLVVYENDTDTTDALGIPAHTLWCIVEGGDVADIVSTIIKNKTGGTGLKGSTSGTYIEAVVKPDGSTYTVTHTEYFDRPTSTRLYARLSVQGIGGATPDTTAIENALAARNFAIAQQVSASELYATVYSVASDFVATLLEISTDGATWTDGSLSPAADAKFALAPADVTVTVIP